MKDRAHFFASVERVVIDDARTINIPSRPDLSASPTTRIRVWNTLVRFDHQIKAGLTWNVRWLREHVPQFNVISPAEGLPVSLAAAREEDDRDQAVVAALNSSLGNTRFNTLRVAVTHEDVLMSNPGFASNGHRQDLLLPTLRYLTYVDQQIGQAQIKRDTGYQADETFSWFVPGQKGDHNLRFGVQYEYVTAKVDVHGNMNGTFVFRTNDPFDAADPRTYPERLTIRVPGSSDLSVRSHHLGAFVQDKWKVGRRLTLTLGLRYDLEVIPIREEDNPRFPDPTDYPVDGNNLAPRVGFAFDPRGDGRTVIRGGYGRFFDKTHFEMISGILNMGVFSNSFIVNFPANAADPGPSRGERPSHPLLRNGPVVDRALLAQLFPPGSRVRNTGNVFLDGPDRRLSYADQLSIGFERALDPHFSLSVDYVHAFGRDQFVLRDLNPGVRVDTTRTERVVRPDPAFVSSCVHARQHRPYGPRRPAAPGRAPVGGPPPLPPGLHPGPHPRQHGRGVRRSRAHESFPVPGRHAAGREPGPHRHRPPAQLRGQRLGGGAQDRRAHRGGGGAPPATGARPTSSPTPPFAPAPCRGRASWGCGSRSEPLLPFESVPLGGKTREAHGGRLRLQARAPSRPRGASSSAGSVVPLRLSVP